MPDPVVSAVRRFAVDFFCSHDPGVCESLMAPDYELTIGRHVIRGRDDQYVPAVQAQFDRFPGLTMSIHDLVVAPGRAALHFSEHGASGGPGGPTATWGGIALFAVKDGRLTKCFAAEDYFARGHQLRGGKSVPVPPVAIAPWDVAVAAPDSAAERAARNWLGSTKACCDPVVTYDDERDNEAAPLEFVVEEVEVLDLFSAGNKVAYAAVHKGNYLGGLGLFHQMEGVELFSTGLVTVTHGLVTAGRVIRDRLSLSKLLN